jgi:multisubunit Na+/H+ antiporter MnhG subunit
MKMPDMYHNWRVMLGVALILLGSGNWLVGRLKTEQYGELIASEGSATPDQAYRSFDELDAGAVAVLAPLTAEQRRVSYATARMDFYHATFLTGYVLVLAGLMLTFLGFLGLIRSDARRATARITNQLSKSPDPDRLRARMAKDRPLE